MRLNLDISTIGFEAFFHRVRQGPMDLFPGSTLAIASTSIPIGFSTTSLSDNLKKPVYFVFDPLASSQYEG
jgi:hypothetical protein